MIFNWDLSDLGSILFSHNSCNCFTEKNNSGTFIVGKLQSFRIKLIKGIIEIIKYTYAGFCGIIFMSLACTKVGNTSVWWYDGTNNCFDQWQILIIVFGLLYAAPFPVILALGLRLLKQNKISYTTNPTECRVPSVE